MIERRSSVFTVCGFLLLLCGPAVLAAPGPSRAEAQPVLVPGSRLEGLLGTPLEALALYRVEAGAPRPIPFQIDERVCTGRGGSEPCTYEVEDRANRSARSRAILEGQDELVFFAEDAGECANETARAPGPSRTRPDVFSPAAVEIRILDLEAGEQGCVYLDRTQGAAPRPSPPEPVRYDPDLDVVTAANYRVAFDPESPYFWRRLWVREGRGAWIPLFAEEGMRSHVVHAVGMVTYGIDRTDMRTRLLGYRAGPIRVIRITRNRLRIGPFLWKETRETAVFYRDRFHTTFHTGTYLHHRFLVEERQRIFTVLDPMAMGWRRLNRGGGWKGLVDGRTSPEEATLGPESEPEWILAGPAGAAVLYRLCSDPPRQGGPALVQQAYLEEGGPFFASVGICIPNLQDSHGPRHGLVKSLFFFRPAPGGPARGLPSLPRQRTLSVQVAGREVSGPIHPPCGLPSKRPAPEGRSEPPPELLKACPSREVGPGPGRPWGIVPVVSAGPDKGFGAGLKFRHRGPLRPDQPLEARFLYTIYQYQIAELSYLAEGLPLRRSALNLACNYYNKTRAKFYGIGNGADESQGRDFTWTDLDLSLVLDKKLPRGFGLLIGWNARWTGVGRGKDAALPDLEDLSPSPFGTEGGWSNGPLLGAYRTTLRPLHDPLTGGRQCFTVWLADDRLGAYSFQRYRLEAVQVVPLPGFPHRLVLRGQAQHMGGEPPFPLLSRVGGDDTARGYFEGRYRDRDRVLLNVEYRANLYKFFDGVLFVDAGRVASDLFDRFPLKGLHITGGFGMRFHVHPDLVVRFDVGFSSEMAAAYLNFGHTF